VLRSLPEACGRSQPPVCAYDLDVLVPADGVRIARQLADRLGGAFYALDTVRDVGRVVLGKTTAGEQRIVDVAAFQGDTLLDDLRGRDFTLNAMAVDLTRRIPTLIDPTGGLGDLRAGCLRAVSPHSLQRDAVRTLRGVRLSAQFGFAIEPATAALIRAAAPALAGVSAERVRDELVRLLALPGTSTSVRMLDALGLLPVVLPELLPLKGLPQPHRAVDGFEHTLQVLAELEHLLPPAGEPATAHLPFREQLTSHLQVVLPGGLSRRLLLTVAALLHDVGKPATQSRTTDGAIHFYDHERIGADLASVVLGRLRFSRPAIGWAATVVRYHVRPLFLSREPVVSRRAVHRFFRDAGAAGVDVVALSLADHPPAGSHTGDPTGAGLLRTAGALLEGWFERRAEVIAPRPLLSGSELVRSFGLTPGPLVGKLQRELQEAQAAGELTTVAQAREWVRRRLQTGCRDNGEE
jgi:putative nucleotidyltransferase with HDIG domain